MRATLLGTPAMIVVHPVGRWSLRLFLHHLCQVHTWMLPAIASALALAVMTVLLDPTLDGLSILAGTLDGP